MEILKALLNLMPTDPVPVRKVVVGVHWVLVCSKYSGLASTLVNAGPHGHSRVRDVGALHQKSAQELAGWALSENLLEASLGMAALNSLLAVDESRLKQVNAEEVIASEGKDQNVVIVGHFPFIERIKTITKNCWVIEKRPFGDDFPEETAQEFIPQAHVVAITGTAFINHTMEELLALCCPDTSVLVLGPSTPLAPLLFQYGISFLSGVRVLNEDDALLTIQQGAIFQQVKGVKLVTMTKGS
jgi:uncharacterized protein (DUF4213/DUF364 family)